MIDTSNGLRRPPRQDQPTIVSRASRARERGSPRGGVTLLAASVVAGALGAVTILAADMSGLAGVVHNRASARLSQALGVDEVALTLVRTTLVSLNDANRTGNYEVLRALAAPEFAARNPAAGLARTFEGFRRAGIDLAAVAVMEPMLVRPPQRDAAGRLIIAGHFPGAPVGVTFDLAFADVDGRWRLHTVGVRTEPTAARRRVATRGGGLTG